MPSAIPKLRMGDLRQDQIAAFYIELRSPLSASLRRWKLPAEEVEDIVQETFVRLLSHWPEGINVEDARFWLFRVAHNLAIDRSRSGWKNRLDPQIDFDHLLSARPSPHVDPEKSYLQREQWQLMQSNLSKLTPRQQHAIYMRIVGLSYKAIARQLNGTTSSVGELIRRALKRLGENGNAPGVL